MEFRFQRFDQRQHSQVFRTHSSSSLSYNFFSSQAPEVLQRPMDIRESIHRELEKERIRSEIISGEIERQRVLEAESRRQMFLESVRFPVMLGQQYPPEIMYGECFAPENSRVIMSSFPERYSSGGRYVVETVPFQRRISSPKVKEIITCQPPKDGRKESIGLGNPFVAGGSKRKPPPSPAGSRAGSGSGSAGLCSNSSKKKIKQEFSCAACEISATCERGLNEHIAGKKHQAKMEELLSTKKSSHIGLGKVMNTVNKQPLEIKNSSDSVSIGSKEDNKTEGCDKQITTRKKFRFWCQLCKIGADDEKIMSTHKKGKKHLKNSLKKEREKTKSLRSKSN